MNQSKSKLIVEGQADSLFFQALIEREQLSIDVEPRYGITKINALLSKLFKDLQDGTVEHLGIVADADYTVPKTEGGFNKRWQQLTQPLKEMGYDITAPPSQSYVGNIFTHEDGLPPIGLWLMPDHKNEGMLEDLIKKTVCEGEQQSLLQTASLCLKQLPIKLFKPHHHTKATLYTWLAWQKRPGQALVSTLNADLIDRHSPEIQSLIKWLREVFDQLI
ncbi:MAG: DUF3226 domain-containing protein [Candidatus Parabeggiatoa sp.]|nr:DUF3226 domain-containing protein [Candidatus Parabeggiatoa sp.]